MSNRDLLISAEGPPNGTQFIKLKLRAKPGKEDEQWSNWITAAQRFDLSQVPEGERIAVRYRVREAD